MNGAEIVDARLMNGAGEREMKDWVKWWIQKKEE